ncbi:hypothetical protein B0H63DRAFT_464065 [Podospora didyma]|uniref:Uncharacterized protein n=1 Tax=Podospora didyma TaxID=330526 RepID=A0AAE0NXM3_9PEZI|nr:hypothetical protein B0H63DRAFT_464065 [Podospora didyma]
MSKAIAPRGVSHDCYLRELWIDDLGVLPITGRAMQSIVGHINTPHAVSARAAAKQIDKLRGGALTIPSQEKMDKIDDFLKQMWFLIFTLAARIPNWHSGQDRLINIVEELKALPANVASEKTVTGNPRSQTPENDAAEALILLSGPPVLRLWKDMPCFINALYDFPICMFAFLYQTLLDKPPSLMLYGVETVKPINDTTRAAYAQWVNFASFTARLQGRGLHNHLAKGVWAMREAFEDFHPVAIGH